MQWLILGTIGLRPSDPTEGIVASAILCILGFVVLRIVAANWIQTMIATWILTVFVCFGFMPWLEIVVVLCIVTAAAVPIFVSERLREERKKHKESNNALQSTRNA